MRSSTFKLNCQSKNDQVDVHCREDPFSEGAHKVKEITEVVIPVKMAEISTPGNQS